MDNNKRTGLRSKAPLVSKSVLPTVIVPTSSREVSQQRRGDIVEVQVEGEHDRGLPFVRGVNKRKRDPRGGGRRLSQQKLESEEGNVLVFVDEDATSSGEDVRKSPGETPLSETDPDITALPQVSTSTYVNIIPDIMPEDHAVMKQLDKRRESSRLRVRPSKFREGFLLGNVKPKTEHKGAADDGTTSLEIVVPVDTHNSSVARSSDNPKASSSQGASESDIDSSFGGPTQTSSVNNNKFKITYKLGSSKGPERRVASVVSPSTASKGVDENELKTALAVVKRVMQIKSAEPFNEPVDPSVLEIPDYFDVISEPMDLGTIRGLLEEGKKYTRALDVYADVQLVWNNCRSYNQDGDPIMDILRIAETVFNKHWNLAALPVPAKAQKVGEGDDIESSDELVGALEQGERDKEKSRKSKDTKNETTLNLQKIVHFDTPTSRLKTKRSASVEQVMAESKAREDKLEVSPLEINNDDANSSPEDADDDGIDEIDEIDKERIVEKVEDGKFQDVPEDVVDTQADGHAVEPEVIPMKGSEEEQTEVEKPCEEEVKTPMQDRDNTACVSSSNKRRIFGTVHHKPECSCVVCVGRRRKLARQEKEGVVEGKKERKHSRSHHPVVNQESPQVARSPRVRKPPKPPQDQEAVTVSPGVAAETQIRERDRTVCQTGNTSEAEATVDDVRYFPATYELPLRKVTPSFLHLSQVLFGKPEDTVWKRHHSLGRRSAPPLSTSSMFAAVHSLSLSER